MADTAEGAIEIRSRACIHEFVFMFFLFPRLEHPAGWICAR